VYARVRDSGVGHRVVVVGYPRLFPLAPTAPTCAPSPVAPRIGPAEIRYLNAKASRLNRAIRRAAASAGVAFVDVEDAFAGHEISCRRDIWVNRAGVGRRFAYSFHPNASGQRRLAALVARALGARYSAASCGRVRAGGGDFYVRVARGRIGCVRALGVIHHVLTHGPPRQGEPGRAPRGWTCGYAYGRTEDGDVARAGPSCSRGSTTVVGTDTRMRPI
jgi:hypothetical protein